MNKKDWVLVAFCLGVITMGVTGCVSNHYKIQTKYINPGDEVEIISEVEGKATIGRVASLYKNVIEFVNKQYIPTKK